MSIYCPQCGQQQLSSGVRFCSRCGFALESVEQLVATGGLPLALRDPQQALSPRQKGMRLGAKVLFASLVSIPIALAISIVADSPAPLLLFVTLFLLGASRLAYARMFDDDAPRADGRRQPTLASQEVGTLSPYRPPAPRRVTTGELEPPPSVTEHTTRLLDE